MKNGFLPLTFIVCVLAVSFAISADYHLQRHDLEGFKQQVLQLNTFCAGHPKICEEFSRLTKIDPILAKKTIENEKCKAFDLLAANLIAQKTRKTIAEVLVGNESADWPRMLRNNGVSLNETTECLEKLNTELALTVMGGDSKKAPPGPR